MDFNFINVKEKDEKFLEQLPSGSGFDCQWEIEDKGKYWKCKNSYHCMNENGYYDDYADFSIIIPKKNPKDFKLHFHNDFSQCQNKKYMLRDYMEDTVLYCLFPARG